MLVRTMHLRDLDQVDPLMQVVDIVPDDQNLPIVRAAAILEADCLASWRWDRA